MGTIKIEDKDLFVPDRIIDAGEEAILNLLASNGFPNVERADLKIEGRESPGAPAIVRVSPRSPGKSGPDSGITRSDYQRFIQALIDAPEYVNPAIDLAARLMRAEASADTELLDRVAATGQLEQAIADGAREGRLVVQALQSLGRVIPSESTTVPVGF